MLRYDAANTGHVPGGSVPTEGVEAQWTFDTESKVTTQPIIVDGTVFVGTTGGTLYALDAQTGAEQWSRNHDESLDSGPVVSGGLVYVPAGSRLLAYSAATGDGQFAVDVGGQVGTPTVSDGTLYTRSGGKLYAIDATGGEVQWSGGSFENNLSAARNDELAVTVSDGSVYVMYPNDDYGGDVYLSSFTADPTAESPEREWQTELEYADDDINFDTTVTAVDGSLYAGLWAGGETQGVVALNAASGSVEWRYTDISNVRTYPTATADTVYAAATGELVGIDPALGTAKWSTDLSGNPTSPILVGDTLIFGSSDNNVYAYDTEGEQRWSFATGNNVVAPPVAVDGTVYTASTDGLVYALQGADTTPDAPDVTGDGNVATDPDGDGLFEDVNGDGEFSVVDVQALFANLDSAAVQDNPELFDFNGDGQVDVTDVQALFASLQEEG
ncbi:PQQ-binding-like beta-propeller repeat protein [Halobaculum sp. MBLA0147]|uniref:outer membrane protein assembly factor BamB family protein n=1 Tax=Halobaculum sp. MBLA0147 TaxID=3079934 RepID=UPI00352589EC